MGVNSLLVIGIFPALLGALADEHRLSAAGIGQAAMLELLAMAVATGLAGMVLPARRLRLIGAAASLGLAAMNLAGLHAAGGAMLALRAGAGVLEGVLLWITVGMIARTVTPERWAGVFFTVQTLGQLGLAFVLAQWVMHRYGADGALVGLALCSLAGVAPALLCPERYAPSPARARRPASCRRRAAGRRSSRSPSTSRAPAASPSICSRWLIRRGSPPMSPAPPTGSAWRRTRSAARWPSSWPVGCAISPSSSSPP